MEAIEDFTAHGLTVKIHYDDCSDRESPLDWGGNTEESGIIFATYERNSILAQSNPLKDYDRGEVLAYAKAQGFEVFDLFKYEHGNVCYQVGVCNPFECRFDSGMVGVVMVKRSEFPERKKSDKGLRAKVAAQLCETVTQWCNGEIYGYVVEDSEGEHLDSCWGFYGLEYCESEGRDAAKYYAQEIRKARFNRLKEMIRNRVPLGVRVDLLA